MANSWRLVSDIVAYFPSGRDEVYLAATEKKTYQSGVIKLIQGYYEELFIGLNEFEIKLGSTNEEKNLVIYLRNKEFPQPEKWYILGNFDYPELGKLLTQLSCDKGYFPETFEAGFSEETPNVTFVCRKMKEYMLYFEEMKRRLNCELYKKTKKWIPGHRYDTLTTSYYYLCSVVSRKKEELNSEFLSDVSLCPEVILYVESVGEGEKTISDIFKNHTFGSGPGDIKILPASKAMVDCGEALINDFSGDIRDYWPELINNSIIQKTEEGHTWCEDIKKVLDIFSYQNFGKTDISITPEQKDKVEGAIKSNLHNIILRNWNIEKYRSSNNIGSKEKDEDNRKAITTAFFSSVKDGNFLKTIYYQVLLKTLGVDIEILTQDVYNQWSESGIYSNFDTFRKYLFYTKERQDIDKHTSKQRVTSTNYKLDIVTLEDLYGNGELRDTILELISEARESFGSGVTDYITVNIGTKKEPKEYTTCKVTLEDIISFKLKKGVLEMSETLKNEILRNKFCEVIVAFDKNGEIK